MRYVALLRGINVGGNGKVDMRELKAVFEAAGVSGVRTYINSGNVIFSADGEDTEALTARLEGAIRKHLGLEIRILLRDVGQMRVLVDAVPDTWTNDASMKCDVVFLWPEFDSPALLEELGPRPEIEDALYVPGAIVWRVDRENATRSRLVRMMGTPLYRNVTVRNINTARTLLRMMEE